MQFVCLIYPETEPNGLEVPTKPTAVPCRDLNGAHKLANAVEKVQSAVAGLIIYSAQGKPTTFTVAEFERAMADYQESIRPARKPHLHTERHVPDVELANRCIDEAKNTPYPKIHAIKRYREQDGCTLGEAKGAIEQAMARTMAQK